MRKWSIWGPLRNPVCTKIRRHRPVSGVVRYKNIESGQNLSLVSQPGLVKTPINHRLDPPFRQKSYLFDFLARHLPAPQNIKKSSLPKSIKIFRNYILDPQGFNFDDFLAPFGSPVSINFPDHLHLLNCNTHDVKISF